MAQQVPCGECGQLCAFDPSLGNKPIRCTRCGAIFYPGANVSATLALSSAGGPQTTQAESPRTESWYLRGDDGRVYGPVDRTKLDTWLGEGRITPRSQVLREGDSQWRWAPEIYPGLRGVAPAATGGGYAGPVTWSQPHRGALILVFGLLGITTGCLVFSLIAWFMGHADMQAMRNGSMDPSGQGMTQAGMVLGMVFSILNLVILLAVGLIFLLPFLLVVIAAAAGA